MPENEGARCCGADRAGNFCEVCGREMRPEDPLLQLLAHVTQKAQRAETVLSHDKSRVSETKLAVLEAHAAKWNAWRVALADVCRA